MPKIVTNRTQKKAQYYVEDLGNGITLDMVLIPGGSFMMGSPEGELERGEDESPQHLVDINQFCMGKYPVTQAQWKAVAALPQVNIELEAEPSKFKGEQRPVEQVSWYDAVEFCDRLSDHTKRQYRLPSEAEWEYACRAGTTTPFHFGETITTDVANYAGTDNQEQTWSGSYGRGPKGIYREETTEVGSFKVANAFGLYDMHGNVWEWCQDTWHSNYDRAPRDGSGWINNNDKEYRLQRGGSWVSNPVNCRSAFRTEANPNGRMMIFGFRVVCDISTITLQHDFSLKERLQDNTHRKAAESLSQIGTGNEKAIAALVELLQSTDVDNDTRKQSIESLGKIGTGNQTVINALMQLLQSTDVDNDTRKQAIESLSQIDPGNQNAISALLQLLQSPDEFK